jgi:RNA polymerase sigma factor (sigma-70 family)
MQQHKPDPNTRPREAPETETIIKDVPGDDSSDLVERIRAGNASAWRELVGRYEPRLRRIARRYRLSSQDVDDVVQLTWLRCLEHLDQLTQADRLQAWLGTICRRECLRMATKVVREVTPGETVVMDLIDSHGSQQDPAVEAVHRDNRARLNQAITALPDRQRFVLRELLDPADRSYLEVSSRLGVPVGSLGPTWQRALGRLRRDPGLADLDPAS